MGNVLHMPARATDDFLTFYLSGSAYNTRKTIRSLYYRHFLPAIARSQEAEFLVALWSETGLGAGAIKKLVALFRAWHKRETGYLPDTAGLMRKVLRNIRRAGVACWTPEQASAGLQAAFENDDEIYDRMLFVLHTGARKEEMYALQKSGCLFTTRTILVCSDPDVDVTKSGKPRAVSMSEDVAEMLERRCARLDDDERVFGTSEMIGRLERITELANIPFKRWHAMRHLYATALLNAGESLATVSEALGHKDKHTTMDIYWQCFTTRVNHDVLPRRKG